MLEQRPVGGEELIDEGRVTVERLLDRMTDLRISEAHHGPANARHYNYVPTYILRGVSRLHLEFDPRT